jgi:hypothetical protein
MISYLASRFSPTDEQKAGDEQLHYGDGPVGPGESAENPAGVSASSADGPAEADIFARGQVFPHSAPERMLLGRVLWEV